MLLLIIPPEVVVVRMNLIFPSLLESVGFCGKVKTMDICSPTFIIKKVFAALNLSYILL